MRRSQESVPLDLAKNLTVTFRQFKANIAGITLETGTAGCGHSISLPREDHYQKMERWHLHDYEVCLLFQPAA